MNKTWLVAATLLSSVALSACSSNSTANTKGTTKQTSETKEQQEVRTYVKTTGPNYLKEFEKIEAAINDTRNAPFSQQKEFAKKNHFHLSEHF
ncbi:hypothetical protein [Fictibacillus macauensis]|nr:hypothetical protein [Fictibacillus macauensis]